MSENDLSEYNEYMKVLEEEVRPDDLFTYSSMKRLLNTHADLNIIKELEKWVDYFEKEHNDTNLINRINELKQE
tara:strand:+ start:786 stop:1007 length:222 start_codon:yes stop_codon:yes gene_type:complete